MLDKNSIRFIEMEEMTFENFISMDTNHFQKATAYSFASQSTDFNVLAIASSTGNGATHLAVATLNEIEKRSAAKEVLCLTYESLVYHRTHNDWAGLLDLEYLNTKAAILIDGISHPGLTKKSDHFFEILRKVTTKVILTYDDGVEAPINKKEIHLRCPSEIEKIKIIKDLLELFEFNLPPDYISAIASRDSLCIRAIKGMLIAIQSISNLSGHLVPLKKI